jgi:hypothetical protein
MWLLPSRGRPDLLKRFFDNAKGLSTPGTILIEKSDKYFEKYLFDIKLPQNWETFVCPEDFENHNPSYAKVIRAWFASNQDYIKKCNWVGLLNDDYIPITENWDTKLIERLNGKNFVCGNDRWKSPERLTGAGVWSGNLLRAVGYLFPEGIGHFYADNMWEDIGGATGLWDICMDIIVLHDHHTMPNKEMDETSLYVEKESGFLQSDKKRYLQWHNEGEFDGALLRIKDMLSHASQQVTPL